VESEHLFQEEMSTADSSPVIEPDFTDSGGHNELPPAAEEEAPPQFDTPPEVDTPPQHFEDDSELPPPPLPED